MIYKSLGFIILSLITSNFTALGQTEPIITYSGSDVAWQITATNNYVGDVQNPMNFINVTADEHGHIYVANFGSVLIFNSETGVLDGAIVDERGTVIQYDDVAVAGEGNIWVADSKTFIVYLLDPDGNILQAIPSNTIDNPDAGMRPNELEVGPDGNLYVMYSSANTVMQVFTPEGEFVRSFMMGDRKLSNGQIDFTFGPDGHLYIAGAATVRVLDTEGNMIVETFAQDFMESGAVTVHGIAVDADGNVYLGGNSFAEDESIIAAIYKFDTDGQLLAQFGKAQQRIDWGSEFKPEELGFAVSHVVLPEGQLVISDANGAYSQLLKVDMTR